MIKNIFTRLAFLAILIFSSSVYALDENIDLCGTASSDTEVDLKNFGNSVAAKNPEICSNDLSYKIIYVVFQKAMEHPETKEFFDGINSVSDQTKVFAHSANISSTIVGIISTFTYVLLILTSVLYLAGFSYGMVKTAKDGSYLGRNSSGFKLTTRILITIALLAPIGGFSLGQLMVLVVAILAIMGGNFMYSTFLSYVSVESTEILTDSQNNLRDTYGQAEDLISSAMCSQRTQRAIIQKNISEYGELGFWASMGNMGEETLNAVKDVGAEAANGISDLWGGGDVAHVSTEEERNNLGEKFTYDLGRKVAYGCTGTYVQADGMDHLQAKSRGTDHSKNLSFANNIPKSYIIQGKDECIDDRLTETNLDSLYSGFDDDIHGYEYSCGAVSYNAPKVEELNAFADIDDMDHYIEMVIAESNGFSNKYSNVDLFQSYRDLYEQNKSKGGDLTPFIDSQAQVFAEMIQKDVEESFDKFKRDRYYQEMAEEGNFVENRVKIETMLLFSLHTQIMGYMLGRNGGDVYIEDVDNDTIFEMMYRSAFSAAENLNAAHCAKEYEEFKDVASFIKNNPVDTSSGHNDEQSWKNIIESVGDGFFECLNLSVGKMEFAGDIESDITNINSPEVADMSEAFKGVYEANEREFKSRYVDDKEVLASWLYIVRESTMQSFANLSKGAVDNSLPLAMRQQGWASAGSYLLTISASQRDKKLYHDILSQTFTVKPSEFASDLTGFIHPNAFTEEKEITDKEESLIPIFLKTSFDSDNNALASNSQYSNDGSNSSDSEEMGVFMMFKKAMLSWFYSPIYHLNAMGGYDTASSLQDSIKECNESGNDCGIGAHPLNSLMNFGHDILNMGIILKVAQKALNMMVSSGDSGNGMIKKLSAIATKFPLLKIVWIIAELAAVFLNAIGGIITAMILAGVFLAYVLPLMPYTGFMIAILGWVVAIVELIILVPIWGLLIGMPKSNGESRVSISMVWASVGQVLLKPALLILALVFAWAFSSVSIFFINATILPLFSMISSGASFIMSLFDAALFYIIYSILAFIALVHTFKIINKITDDVLKKSRVDPASDQMLIDNLAIERLVQTKIMADTIEGVAGGAGSTAGTGARKALNKLKGKK